MDQEGSGGPAVGPGSVGRPSRRTGSGWNALQEGQEESGCPPGGTRGDERSSRRNERSFRWAGRGWEYLPECREWSGGTFEKL